jgi:hypothetical protein
MRYVMSNELDSGYRTRHRQLRDMPEKEFKLHFQHTKKMHEFRWGVDEKNNDRFGEADVNTTLASSVSSKARSPPRLQAHRMSDKLDFAYRTPHRQLRDMSGKEFELLFYWDIGRRDGGGSGEADANITLARFLQRQSFTVSDYFLIASIGNAVALFITSFKEQEQPPCAGNVCRITGFGRSRCKHHPRYFSFQEQ